MKVLLAFGWGLPEHCRFSIPGPYPLNVSGNLQALWQVKKMSMPFPHAPDQGQYHSGVEPPIVQQICYRGEVRVLEQWATRARSQGMPGLEPEPDRLIYDPFHKAGTFWKGIEIQTDTQKGTKKLYDKKRDRKTRVKNRDENRECDQGPGGRRRHHIKFIEHLLLSRCGDKRKDLGSLPSMSGWILRSRDEG